MADRQNRRPEPNPVTGQQTERHDAETADTIDLMAILYRLLANWKLILICALLGAALAAIYTFRFVTPLYRATAEIYVVSRKDSAINVSDLQVGTQLTNDYIQIFKTWEVQEQVIANLNLPYSYNKMRSMLSISNPSNTRMLDITVTSPSAKEAAEIANEYARVGSEYISEKMSTDKPNIMSSALVPVNPFSPSKTRNIVLGFILGALVISAVITLRAILDDKYKTTEDIRKYTGLVTLAIVPLEDSDVDVETKKSRQSRRNA